MNKRFYLCAGILPLTLAVALVAGCATQVAVSPQDNTIASYHEWNLGYDQWGTLSGNASGSVDTAFHATNRALDELKYFRVKERTDPDKAPFKKATVYARGTLDSLVTVTITPGVPDGNVHIEVQLDPNDLPKSQVIFYTIMQQLNGSPNSSSPAVTSGLYPR